MQYVSNAFTLAMVPENSVLDVVPATSTEVAAALDAGAQNIVGHADVARLISAMLGREVTLNRVSVMLVPGDVLYVAQYMGPRLPEGTTLLPEGATLSWRRLTVVCPSWCYQGDGPAPAPAAGSGCC